MECRVNFGSDSTTRADGHSSFSSLNREPEVGTMEQRERFHLLTFRHE